MINEPHSTFSASHISAGAPLNQIVTAAQLRMKPGQKLAEKAKELGVTPQTLKLWHAEWRGSQYDPDYVIPRAGHNNWLRNKWVAKDWPALIRAEIARKRARHIGDVLLAVGITAANAQDWSQRHAEFERALWKSGVPYRKRHWRDFVGWIRHGTIDRYRHLKAEKIAAGMTETEAMHAAADEAVNELRHKTRQRRRVERDILMGVGMHEEMTKRWQRGGRLWDAHSKRIAKKLVTVSRYAAMERGLRQVGYREKEIEAKLGELKSAFANSPEKGQAQWQQLRKGILRKKARTEAQARADQAEARAIEQLPGVRATKFVKQQIAKR